MKSVIKKIDALIANLEHENKMLRSLNSQFTVSGLYVDALVMDNEAQMQRLRTAKQILKG